MLRSCFPFFFFWFLIEVCFTKVECISLNCNIWYILINAYTCVIQLSRYQTFQKIPLFPSEYLCQSLFWILSSCIFFASSKFHTSGLLEYVSFCVQLLSFSVFIHDGWFISRLFIFIAEYYSLILIYCHLLIHVPIDGQLSIFQFGAIINKTTVNICEQMFV